MGNLMSVSIDDCSPGPAPTRCSARGLGSVACTDRGNQSAADSPGLGDAPPMRSPDDGTGRPLGTTEVVDDTRDANSEGALTSSGASGALRESASRRTAEGSIP